MLAAWASAQGDKTMRLEYPLGPGDVVVDADGGDGQWASDIVARYGSTVHVFEPLPGLAETIGARLGANPLIKLHAATLGQVDGEVEISAGGGQTPQAKLRVQAIGPQSLFARGHFEEIALLKISLGGREYDFLDTLLSAGLMSRVRDLQVQFSDFGPDATTRLQAVQRLLRETHEITYQYPFLWESWRRKSLP